MVFSAFQKPVGKPRLGAKTTCFLLLVQILVVKTSASIRQVNLLWLMSWFHSEPSFPLYQAEKDDLQSPSPLPWPGDFVYLLSCHGGTLGMWCPSQSLFPTRQVVPPRRMASKASIETRASENTGDNKAGRSVTDTGPREGQPQPHTDPDADSR